MTRRFETHELCRVVLPSWHKWNRDPEDYIPGKRGIAPLPGAQKEMDFVNYSGVTKLDAPTVGSGPCVMTVDDIDDLPAFLRREAD